MKFMTVFSFWTRHCSTQTPTALVSRYLLTCSMDVACFMRPRTAKTIGTCHYQG